jgi:hypothetical protein
MISTPIGTTASGGRSFSVAFRIEFLQAWDECVAHGDKARLLREHNLAKGTVKRWLNARARGEFDASLQAAEVKMGRRQQHNEDRSEVIRLRRQVEQLEQKVKNAEAAQEIMGKAFELLDGITKSSTGPDAQIPPTLMSAAEYQTWLERKKL